MSSRQVTYTINLRDRFSNKLLLATKSTDRLTSAVGRSKAAMVSLGSSMTSMLGIFSAGVAVKSIVNATTSLQALENQFKFAAGSARQGASDFEFIRESVNYLGLDLESTSKSFARFAAATKGTKLEGKATRDIFEGVAMGATVMHLSASETEGALYAIQQMVSKGKVSTEELSRQLGERMPGTFQLAAKSMNMTTEELSKQLKAGKIFAEDFLPLFGKMLKEHYSSGIEDARKSMQSELGRMATSWFDLKSQMGRSQQGMINTSIIWATKMTNLVANSFKNVNTQAEAFAKHGAEAFTWWDKLLSINTSIGAFLLGTNASGDYAEQMNFANTVYKHLAPVTKLNKDNENVLNVPATMSNLAQAQEMLESQKSAWKKGEFGDFGSESAFNKFNRHTAVLKEQIVGLKDALKPENKMGLFDADGKPLDHIKVDPTAAGTAGSSTTSVEARQPQNFYIDIEKFGEMTINTKNISESASNVKDILTQSLVEAVNNFQIIAAK